MLLSIAQKRVERFQNLHRLDIVQVRLNDLETIVRLLIGCAEGSTPAYATFGGPIRRLRRFPSFRIRGQLMPAVSRGSFFLGTGRHS